MDWLVRYCACRSVFRLSFAAQLAGDVDDMSVCSELGLIVLKRYRGQWFVVIWLSLMDWLVRYCACRSVFRLSFAAQLAGDVDDMSVCSELGLIVLKRYRGQWFVVIWLSL
ncbi:uncharacterized protein DC041_0007439 [Schistosoma bovis]|uniref:Uncharacterized protein n=1 Tax=Schistosoma bovis TaxID=6184 RepID=A0A430QUF8_SCHBO|nr:uncharacterized protein DC041_0007439 [Schistosoma bovis]